MGSICSGKTLGRPSDLTVVGPDGATRGVPLRSVIARSSMPTTARSASRSFRSRSTARRPRTIWRRRSRSAGSRPVNSMGVIIGGLASLVGGVHHEPDARRWRPRARSASPSQIGDVFFTSRSDHDAAHRGHPFGEPGGREHPAVPATRRRPDADDHAQARLRLAHQPAGRAADLPGRVRLPLRVPYLGVRLRCGPDSSTGGRCPSHDARHHRHHASTDRDRRRQRRPRRLATIRSSSSR